MEVLTTKNASADGGASPQESTHELYNSSQRFLRTCYLSGRAVYEPVSGAVGRTSVLLFPSGPGRYSDST